MIIMIMIIMIITIMIIIIITAVLAAKRPEARMGWPFQRLVSKAPEHFTHFTQMTRRSQHGTSTHGLPRLPGDSMALRRPGYLFQLISLGSGTFGWSLSSSQPMLRKQTGNRAPTLTRSANATIFDHVVTCCDIVPELQDRSSGSASVYPAMRP